MSEWMAIKDVEPKKGIDVQVYCSDTKEQMVAFYIGCGRFQFGTYPTSQPNFNGILICTPTHWMPLPEPPQ